MCVYMCVYMSMCVCVCVCVYVFVCICVCVVKATEIHSGSKLPENHTVSLTVVTTLHIRSSVDEPGGAVRRETGKHRRQTPPVPPPCRASESPVPRHRPMAGTGRGTLARAKPQPCGRSGTPLLTPSGGGLAGAGSSECPLQRSRKGEPRITGAGSPEDPAGGPGLTRRRERAAK